MNVTDRYTQIYSLAKQYLTDITPQEISPQELSKYFNVYKSFTTLNDVLYQLLDSLQNNQMMPNVIGFKNPERMPIFRKILFDYDPILILDTYKSFDVLFTKFKENFEIRNTESKRNLWLRYAKSVMSACTFISTFKDADDFDNFVNSSYYNEFTISALPMLLEKEIFGLGFPLACDFLKELGYVQYPKPDVHIKDVFVAFRLCKNNDFDAYKAVIKMAKINKDTPYNVDKVFWLICSGRFYLHNIEIKRHKTDFIEFVKKSLT